ncbi:MAG: tRNA 2-thiocytidine biosynthesis protein TtcA [Gammaproteobacteria bacterium]|nr:tRNA 2-thiocytidine biosynthesis protein TtcA [Gammaproteobacteria bacterium]
MIRAGDRVLLGVSGGKDSLSLLQVLLHLQRHAPIKFEVGAISVDPMVEGFEPGRLQPHMQTWNVPWFLERQPIAERAQRHMGNDSFCAFCSRMKRGIMYATARREGYNVVALAQHLDDLAESFLLSAFYGGQLRTMKAHYTNRDGDLRIIRPFIYVRERQTRDFAAQAGLPVVPDSCPACFAHPAQRQHLKSLLAGEEARNNRLFDSILRAIGPLMSVKTAD